MKQPNCPVSPTRSASRSARLLLAAALVGLPLTMAGVSAVDANLAQTARVSQSAERGYLGNTMPSEEVDLAFANLGKVSEVRVKEGDRIEAGDVLMRQDDTPDQARLKALRAKADIAARVQLAQQRRDLAAVQLKRAEELRQSGAGSASQLEEAQLNEAIAQTQIIEEERQGLVAEAEAQEQEAIIAQKTLTSPTGGVVQEVEAAVGEVFGPQTPALRLLRIDPLEVESLLAPAREVRRLKVGDTIQVRYDDEEEWREATVTFIDPQVNESAQTQAFRAELPNPEGRPAGLRVYVRLPAAPAGEAAAAW